MGKESNARTTLIKVVVTCLVVALSFGIIFIGEYTISPDEDTSESAATAGMSFTPGTYTATASGMESDVEVTATFDEDSITDISIDVSGETAGIGAEIGDEMTQQFLAAQSASVDGVSGASVTSGALMDAMQDCIDQAAGGGSAEAAETEEETEAAAEEPAEAEDETEAAAGEPAGAEEAAAEAAGAAAGAAAVEEAGAQAAAGETQEQAADEEDNAAAEAEASTGIYNPGTYTATVEGAHGDISVSATFTENAIVAIASDLSCENEDTGAVIGPEISKQILDAQSAEVDGISGATVTSDAFKSAVNDCIAQASAGDSAYQEASEEAGEAGTGEGAAAAAAESTSGEDVYTPGTYSASAEGMDSTVTVSLLFNENSILSASCDVSGETEEIGAVIGPEICKQILDAQSADIDGVSGATVTSDAVKEAAAECISLARGEE